MKTMTMPSANGAAPILIEKILDSELGAHCALYARVTIPAGSILGYHEHHGNGESYYILSGRAIYNDNGTTREIAPGDATWTLTYPPTEGSREAMAIRGAPATESTTPPEPSRWCLWR